MDALLRRTLRAPAGDLPAPCPDVESLAAFADASLSPAEHESVATHAAGCERCQGVLAALVRTETVVPGAEVACRPRPWWRRLIAPRWVVPLSAAATAVALYVAGTPRGEAPVQAPASNPPVVARAEPPAAPAPEAGPPPESKDTAAPPLPAEPPRTSTREAPASAPAETAPQDAAKREERPANTRTLGETLPAPSASTAASEKPAGEPGVQPAPGPQGFADRSTAQGIGAAAFAQRAGPPLDVRAPDGRERWRLAGGRIEHSRDDGATWTTAELTGVPPSALVALVAGASPAPGVCWMAGADGLVLRTTDGSTWSAVPFPERTHLAAITASSASAATVRDAAGRSWSTSDGGSHWNASPF
jgi:hypothetical protein